MQRNIGGRGLIQVKQTVAEVKRALGEYLKSSNVAAIKEVAKENYSKKQRLKSSSKKNE